MNETRKLNIHFEMLNREELIMRMEISIPRNPSPKALPRRGTAAVMAMLFLVIMVTLAGAMFTISGSNLQTATNLDDVSRAQAAAESGLRWMSYRIKTMSLPKTTAGIVTTTVATDVWGRSDGMKDRLVSSLQAVRGISNVPITVTSSSTLVSTSTMPTDLDGALFSVQVRPLTSADGFDSRYLRVTSTGQSRSAIRKVTMDFFIEKRVKFAVVGKVPIQLGRNTIVEGPIAMGTANKYPPILMLSDFTQIDATLASRINAFNTFLKSSSIVSGQSVSNHTGFDNRISINNPLEYGLATAAGYHDTNGDAYIDEYDLFLDRFDTNHDKAVSTAEITNPSTGKLYEPDFFKAMDSINSPLFNEDKNGNGVLDPGEDTNGNGMLDVDPVRSGFQDGIIDNRDGYAKVRGQILLAPTASGWQANINSTSPGQTINDFMQGPTTPTEPGQIPVKFGVSSSDMIDLNPANFEGVTQNFAAQSGSAGGTASRGSTVIANTTLSAADVSYSVPYVTVTAAGQSGLTVGSVITQAAFNTANTGLPTNKKATSTAAPTTLDEHTPSGSTTWQATYRRPVFRGVTFKNVKIPKGLNALFEGCTFQGVTYVDMTHDITNTSGSVTTDPNDGMTWAKRMKANQGTFAANTVLTTTNSKAFDEGNNLHFNNCNFEGPVAEGYSTAYSHFSNSWEFTGATLFNNKVDQTATIVAPQTNIEMGSFTNPSQAPSTLTGVVVAGNIDIRGSSVVDGSIIVTGDGAGNTTLAYFGADDAQTSAGANPEGGYGRLNIRYNPYRALPDGINIAVTVSPLVSTYEEGK